LGRGVRVEADVEFGVEVDVDGIVVGNGEDVDVGLGVKDGAMERRLSIAPAHSGRRNVSTVAEASSATNSTMARMAGSLPFPIRSSI
jgi:hypothetical protein